MRYTQYIKDGLLAWTLTSNGYKYLTWNFVEHWRRSVKGQPICVVCADKPSYSFLTREGVSCVLADDLVADFGPDICPFGSRTFSVLNRVKLRLLNAFAQDAQVEMCLYIDGDICVYKDICADIRERLAAAPMLLQCDEKDNCSGSGCPNLCTGLVAWRHGADGGVFKIDNEAKWAEKPEDQVWFNWKRQELNLPVEALPREIYPNGMLATKTKNNPELAEKAICLHYNYRVGGSKKTDMKRLGDWLLPY